MIKFLLLLLSVLLVIVAVATSDTKIDRNCDRILNSMMDRCKSVQNALTSPIDLVDSKETCCLNFRYNMCVLSVKHYTNLGKIAQICPSEVYDLKIAELESNYIGKNVVETLCEEFESHTCITEPLSNAWDSVKANVQSGIDEVEKSWNAWTRLLKSFGVFRRDEPK